MVAPISVLDPAMAPHWPDSMAKRLLGVSADTAD